MAAKYSETITSRSGSVAKGAIVALADGSGNPIELFSDSALSASLGFAAVTDDDGYIECYLADGTYTRTITYGNVSKSVQNVELYDLSQIASLAPDLASTASGKGGDQVAKAVTAPKPQDYGGVGNGTADDTTPISTLDALTAKKYLPAGSYKTTLASTALNGPFWGEGRVIDNSTNKRAPWFAAVKAAPSISGSWNSIETAFNGDLSKVLLPIEARITGATTLTQPATGYVYTPEAYPVIGYLYNSSGWNQQTGGNDGRTAACLFRGKVDQYGQGDAVVYNAAAFVTGARAGATHFLANPAAVLFNGDMTAGQAGVYMNPYETYCTDNGYDVAHVGHVINGYRSISTGALSVWWGGSRYQSVGSAAWDNIISATGKFNAGIDLSMTALDFGTNKAAISLKADSRVYFNNASSNGNFTTSFNGWYLEYNSSLGGYQFVTNGTSGFQITAGQVTTLFAFKQKTFTVATLPASPTSGLECYVSDANATTRLSTVAGGGANFVKVFYNGTNWLIQ